MHDHSQGGTTASMIEIVQDVISTDVAGPLLNGVWGLLETLKALPTAPEPLGWDGVTVEKIALTQCAPEESHPMLTWQVNGIGIGDGASRVRWLTGHLVGAVHVLKILADEGIALAGSSQRCCVVHVFLLHVSQGKGSFHRPAIVYLDQTLVHIIEKQGLESEIAASESQSDVDQHPQQGCAGFYSVFHSCQIDGDHEIALVKEVGIQQVGVSFAFA